MGRLHCAGEKYRSGTSAGLGGGDPCPVPVTRLAALLTSLVLFFKREAGFDLPCSSRLSPAAGLLAYETLALAAGCFCLDHLNFGLGLTLCGFATLLKLSFLFFAFGIARRILLK